MATCETDCRAGDMHVFGVLVARMCDRIEGIREAEAAHLDTSIREASNHTIIYATKRPDVTQLFRGNIEYLLVFAPVDIALMIVATRDALGRAETWGDVKRTISAERLAELVEWEIGGDEAPDDDESFEAPDCWPSLHYNDMPGWLPEHVVARFGRTFDSMLDSGVNFEYDDADQIVQALEATGVTVRSDGPDLETLFAEE